MELRLVLLIVLVGLTVFVLPPMIYSFETAGNDGYLVAPNGKLRLNREVAEKLGVPRFWEYFREKIADAPEGKTVLVVVDTGIWEQQPWLKDYFENGDIGPPDDREYYLLRDRHGTQMAAIMASLMPLNGEESDIWIESVRVGLRGGRALSELIDALEALFIRLEAEHGNRGEKRQIVLNMSFSFSLTPSSSGEYYVRQRMSRYWRDSKNGPEIFEDFKVNFQEQPEALSFDEGQIDYEVLLQLIERYNPDLPQMDLLMKAQEWLFHKLFIEGSLEYADDMLVKTDTWGILGKFDQIGCKLFASSGHSKQEQAPAMFDEWVTSVAQVDWDGKTFGLSQEAGGWTDYVFYSEYDVHNELEDAFDPGIRGSSSSTAALSSFYAQIWRLAGNIVTRDEMDEIISRTALLQAREGDFLLRIPHPWRAIRVGWVYGNIKRLLNEYRQDLLTFDDFQKKVSKALHDTDDGRTFFDPDILEKIAAVSQRESQPSRLLDILIDAVRKIVP